MAAQWLVVAGVLSLGFQAAADCSCKWQGAVLPSSLYSGSAHSSLANIGLYGTMCAAWDMVPDTPNFASCDGGDFSGSENWCQVPWCYVDSSCSSAVATSAFAGQDLHYSYLTCGGVDCYGKTGLGCPYDPNGDSSYTIAKSGDCACTYHGSVLPAATYTDYPVSDVGKYKDLANIAIYGTTCAAWDMAPDTPFVSSCPSGADWCAYDKNWCVAPWCYVDAACLTKAPSSVFMGSSVVQYSYDTCVSTPNCYTNSGEGDRDSLPSECPYDSADNNWWTPKTCSAYTSSADTSTTTATTTTNDVDSASGVAGAAGVLLIAALAPHA